MSAHTLCPALCEPTARSPPGSSVHRISQAGILEWVAISFSRGSSRPRDPAHSHVSCIGRRVLYHERHLGSLSLDNSQWRKLQDHFRDVYHWIIKKAIEFQQNIYFCFINYAKAFDCVDNNKLWKILKEMGILDHLTCLPRNLYTGQEATVRTGHWRTDWFQIRKGVRQGYTLSPCLFNLYAEYITRNAGLDEA